MTYITYKLYNTYMNSSELRTNLKSVLDACRDGEIITIMRGDETFELKLVKRKLNPLTSKFVKHRKQVERQELKNRQPVPQPIEPLVPMVKSVLPDTIPTKPTETFRQKLERQEREDRQKRMRS